MSIMTRDREYGRRRISADEAHSLRSACLRRGPDGSELLLKNVARAPSSWNAATRSARFVMSTQAVDRAGDVVVTAGLDITEFQKNPQAFLFHDSRSWSVGRWANIEKHLRAQPPRMEGDVILHPAGGPVATVDQAAWMIQHGGLSASSIGFLPNWDDIERVLDAHGQPTGGLIFNSAEIIEVSLVGVPANRQSLAKGWPGVKPDAHAERVRQVKRELELQVLRQRSIELEDMRRRGS